MRPSLRLLSSVAQRALNANAWEHTRLAAGLPHHTSFAWLRDACPCPSCVHPSTLARMHQTAAIPADLAPAEAPRVDGGSLHVSWPDGHRSAYPLSYLKQYISPRARTVFRRDPVPVHWADGAGVASAPKLRTDYKALHTDKGMLAALEQLTTYGLLFVRGVPNKNEGPEDIEGLAQRFGEVRETFYGRVFDVRTLRDSTNIAYTNLDLGLHMDLLYFEHPPRFQILHCLRNRVRGGASYFVDARAAARNLSARDIATLARAPLEFACVNAGHHLHRRHPTLELAPLPFGAPDPLHAVPLAPESTEDMELANEGEIQRALADRITHVNYAPPFQAPLPPNTPASLFGSLGRFAARLARPEARFTHTLAEGEAVLFDNRRVLHARTAFDDIAVGEGETSRWLKGCYVEADAVLDRRRVLLDKLGML